MKRNMNSEGSSEAKEARNESTEALSSVSEDKEGEAIAGPLCFSCLKCRSIVGDSFSFLTSDESAQTITLSASSNIQRSADVYTSKSGSDVGSTYFNFTCSNCQAQLGRYYLTTSKDLDELREKFTFNVNNIQSYELGKAQHGKMPDPIPDEEAAVNKGTEVGAGPSAGTEIVETVSGMSKEILKVQHVLVDVLERIEKLEARHYQLGHLTGVAGHNASAGAKRKR